MTLYEINRGIENILTRYDFGQQCVDMETGEIVAPELPYQMLNALMIDKEAKIDNICLFIKNEEAQAKAIDEEIKALGARLKAKRKRVEGLKSLVACELAGKKRERANYVVNFRKNESVSISVEPDKLPDEFQRVKRIVEADKVGIKAALKAGASIDGAELVTSTSCTIK